MLHMWVYVSHMGMLRCLAWPGNFWDLIKGQKQQSNRHPEGWCGGPVLIQMTALTSKTSKQRKPQHWQKTLWGSAEAVHDQSRHCLIVKAFSSLITTVRGKKKKKSDPICTPRRQLIEETKLPANRPLWLVKKPSTKKCLLGCWDFFFSLFLLWWNI